MPDGQPDLLEGPGSGPVLAFAPFAAPNESADDIHLRDRHRLRLDHRYQIFVPGRAVLQQFVVLVVDPHV